MTVVLNPKTKIMANQQIVSDMRRKLRDDPALAARFLQRLMGLREFRDMLKKSRSFKPRMDLHDDPGSPLVTAVLELPGVRRDDITIQLQDEYLIICANRRPYSPVMLGTAMRTVHHTQEHTKVHPVVNEVQYGRVRRVLKVPQGSKVEDVQVALADGMLSLSWPRKPRTHESTTEDMTSPEIHDNNIPVMME